VLIIDDCSTDATARVGADLAAEDSRVTFRRHSVNSGHLKTYNEGLLWASGGYTVLLSADDLLVPGSLGRAAAVLDAHPEVGFAYGRSLRFESDDALPAARTGMARPRFWDGWEWIARRCRTATNCISSPEVVVRTELQHRLGGYRHDLRHSGDLEMWLRLAAVADVAYLCDVDQAFYRVHAGSMLRTSWTAPIDDLGQRLAAFDAVLGDRARSSPEAARLQNMAHQALAREALWEACRAYDSGVYDPAAVDSLEDFAFDAFAPASALREHSGLRWRRRVGPRWCKRVGRLQPSVATHRLRSELWWRRWRVSGV